MLKKLISFVIVAIMILSSVVSVLPVFAVSATLGDIDGDGEIDSFDYLKLKRYVLGMYDMSSEEYAAADINSDGNVNTIDYILLRRMALGTLDDVTVMRKVAVSCGKSYTTSVSASASYEDTYNSELTDGAVSTSASFYNGAYCGFDSNVDIVIDLGNDGENLCSFELSYLSANEAGILPPRSLKVYGSNSASSVNNLLGSISVPDYVDTRVLSVEINLSEFVNYRYIRFSVAKASSWVFIDECLVYAKVEVEEGDIAPSPSEIYQNDTLTDAQLKANLDSVASGNEYNAELGENLISNSRYASVTVNSPAGIDPRCSNSASCLKDAFSTGTAYDSKKWYGINASESSEIIINLASTIYNINGFSLHCFNRKVSSITLPPYVDVSVSTNGSSYTKLGRVYSINTEQENYAFTLILDTLVRARYVKFTLAAGSDYYWIEEAEVYQNAAPSGSTVYGDFEMAFVKESISWSNAESDYNTYQNLLNAKRAEILSDTSLSLADYHDTNGTEYESILLTDGETTQSNDCYDPNWFRFYMGGGRSLYYDLGYLSSVSEFSVHALRKDGWGVTLPSPIKLVLSEDGLNWYLAGELTFAAADDSVTYAAKTLDKSYKARYAMLYFPVYAHVFIDEIAVNGTKNISEAVSLADSGLTLHSTTSTEYIAPSADLLGGAEDIMLVYHNVGVVTKEMISPYVAYIDKNGNTVDAMYDGFLFLPAPGMLPSGGTPYGTNNVSDWNYLYDQLFMADRNFDALEKAVVEAKKLLNKPDYKVQVYITIPHLDSSLYGSSFGDIDNDGDNEDLRYLNNRVYVAKYYAQKYIDRFASMDYQNIEIGGFYWFHEAISPYGDDAKTAQQLNKDFDAMGIDLFWIPYYHAEGYNYSSTFGFDAVFYQPNYAFGALIEESRIKSATSEAIQYGMTMEMEIDSSAVSDIRFFRKYMGYLAGGVKYGYINNTILAYYQSFDDIGVAADSKNERVRLIYDYTYQFIKGTLDINPETVDDLAFYVKAETPYSYTLNTEKDGTLEYKIAVSPKHGTVSIDADGRFVYYPNKDYTGTDSFTYRIGNYLGWSEECTVNIRVG